MIYQGPAQSSSSWCLLRRDPQQHKPGAMTPPSPSPQHWAALEASCRMHSWGLPVLHCISALLSGGPASKVLTFGCYFAPTAGENKFLVMAKTFFCSVSCQTRSGPSLISRATAHGSSSLEPLRPFYLTKQKVQRFTACGSYAEHTDLCWVSSIYI